MFSISKTYAIKKGVAAKNSETDQIKNRAIYLPEKVDGAFEADAKRCRRSFVKHLEALIVAYLRIEDVELMDLDGVQAAMQILPGSPSIEVGEIDTKLSDQTTKGRGARTSKASSLDKGRKTSKKGGRK
jgi:hypothetical protein